MKITLLGSTGFVGSYLLPALSSAGHRCRALTRYRPGCRQLEVIPHLEIVQTDLFDAEQLAGHVADADAVINMVGILNEPGRQGKGFRRAHVELTENLIQACRAGGVRRVLQVSALNAGEGESYYLRSKGEAEQMLREAVDIDETIVQPSVIFGQGDTFFNCFNELLKVLPVLPLACPQARLQPVWAGDVACAITMAIEDPQSIGQTLIMVGPDEFTLKELVEYTATAAGRKRRIVGLPDALARLQGRLMDFIPGKPFSSDNYKSLQIDNTSVENSLWQFGITPRSIDSVVPAYLRGSRHQDRLDRYRRQVVSR